MTKTAIIAAIAVIAGTPALAEPLPVPKPPWPGGSCPLLRETESEMKRVLRNPAFKRAANRRPKNARKSRRVVRDS